jgi:hypothetical protein
MEKPQINPTGMGRGSDLSPAWEAMALKGYAGRGNSNGPGKNSAQ